MKNDAVLNYNGINVNDIDDTIVNNFEDSEDRDLGELSKDRDISDSVKEYLQSIGNFKNIHWKRNWILENEFQKVMKLQKNY